MHVLYNYQIQELFKILLESYKKKKWLHILIKLLFPNFPTNFVLIFQ